MIIQNDLLASLSLELSIMKEDKEGQLRGGFSTFNSTSSALENSNGNCNCNCSCGTSNGNCNCNCGGCATNNNCNTCTTGSTATATATGNNASSILGFGSSFLF